MQEKLFLDYAVFGLLMQWISSKMMRLIRVDHEFFFSACNGVKQHVLEHTWNGNEYLTTSRIVDAGVSHVNSPD